MLLIINKNDNFFLSGNVIKSIDGNKFSIDSKKDSFIISDLRNDNSITASIVKLEGYMFERILICKGSLKCSNPSCI